MSRTLTPAEAFPPGDLLREEIQERGWSVAEFADILGRPTQAVSEILNGRKAITAATAAAIGTALGTSAEVWLSLQAAKDLAAVDHDAAGLDEVSRRARLRELVPLRAIQKRGWVPGGSDLDAIEPAVCALLGISDVTIGSRR